MSLRIIQIHLCTDLIDSFIDQINVQILHLCFLNMNFKIILIQINELKNHSDPLVHRFIENSDSKEQQMALLHIFYSLNIE